MESHELPWEPLHPDALPALFESVDAPWWLAGGWAIDAFMGRVTRVHEDTDVLVLRRDHLAFRAALADWDVHAADPPGRLRTWALGEALAGEVHDVWCRRTPDHPWALQLMIDDSDGDDWIYRRDGRLRRPLASLSGPASDERRQVLAPEIQLLQKSKGRRPKDEADFGVTVPELDGVAKGWLRDALDLVSTGHAWAEVLS